MVATCHVRLAAARDYRARAVPFGKFFGRDGVFAEVPVSRAVEAPSGSFSDAHRGAVRTRRRARSPRGMAGMSRLRRLNGGYMLKSMTPRNKLWALLVVLSLGFWAGGAAAQSDEDGGWFDEAEPSAPSDRPTLKIHGEGKYDPPPPDFSSDPPIVRDESGADEAGSSYDEEDIEDPASQQQAVTEFSPRLAPYGYWVEDPYYGRVWVPNRSVVGPDFRPYVTAGHWELTPEDEWLWASDYPFGGITFHYGRWAWLSGGSWGWVPGYVYAPAWVDFRIGASGYVGWGPAPPYSVWRGGVFVGVGLYRPVPYIFCPTSYVFSASLPRYVVYDRHRVRSIAAQTHRYRPRYVAGSSVRVRGPSVREARIPSRYVPARRVIAEPSGGRVRGYRSEQAGRNTSVRERGTHRGGGASRYDRGSRRDFDTRRSAPQRSFDTPSHYRGSATSRPRDTSRGRRDPGVTSHQGSVSPGRWAERRPDGDRNGRNAGSERRRGTASGAPPPARGRTDVSRDASRGRSYSAPPQRRDTGASRATERRGGGEARRSGSGSSRSPSQQRSRDRDSRGSR
jgi:hypothetical protein